MSTTDTYTVAGMTCDHCTRSVAEEVSAVAGITAVDVQLATGRLTITTSQPVTVEQVEAAVAEAGYSLTT
jgi:copper chaperone CopZ